MTDDWYPGDLWLRTDHRWLMTHDSWPMTHDWCLMPWWLSTGESYSLPIVFPWSSNDRKTFIKFIRFVDRSLLPCLYWHLFFFFLSFYRAYLVILAFMVFWLFVAICNDCGAFLDNLVHRWKKKGGLIILQFTSRSPIFFSFVFVFCFCFRIDLLFGSFFFFQISKRFGFCSWNNFLFVPKTTITATTTIRKNCTLLTY